MRWSGIKWSCPRCNQVPGKWCRDRHGRERRRLHLRRKLLEALERLVHGLVADRDDRWTFAVGLLNGSLREEAGPAARRWEEPAAGFVALTRAASVAAAVEELTKTALAPHLDLTASRAAARRLREEVKQAAQAARQLAVGLPEGARLRSGRPLPARPRPEQVQEAVEVADLDALQLLLRRRRRAAESAAAVGQDRPWWTLTYDPDRGGFHAAGQGGRELVGWAPLPAAAEDLLRGCDAAGAPVRVRWAGAYPRLPRRCDDPWQRPSLDTDDLRRMLTDRSSPELAALAAAVTGLRDTIALPRLEEHLAAAAADLQATAPQPPDPDGELNAEDAGGEATAAGWMWVPAATVVTTYAAREWGDFGDHRPGQLALIARALLTADDVYATIATVLSEYGSPVSLRRHPGPAGPIHTLGSNGCHRIHLWRMLGLPYLLADVTVPAIPRQVGIGQDWPYEPYEEDEDPIPMWEGLIRRGLLDADVDAPRHALRPVRVPALWFLASPTTACAVNTTYSRLYPGSLDALGIPPGVAGDPQAWRAWLTTSS